MEGGRVSVTIPEDIVERILSMVPFPYVFKARVLSKSWLARFSLIPPQKGGEKQKKRWHGAPKRKLEKELLTTSFQKQMGEFSVKWKTFFPAYVGKQLLLAYDRESQNWRKIPSLSVLPGKHRLKSFSACLEDLEGALLLVSTYRGALYKLYVANILTRSWKQLPPRPHGGGRGQIAPLRPYGGGRGYPVKFVGHSSSEGYKLIEFYTEDGHYQAQIYDSKLGVWSTKRLDLPEGFKVLSNNVYLNGVCYWVVGPNELNRGLLALNVKEETFELLQMPFTDIPIQHFLIPRVNLVVCNATLLMVVCYHSHCEPFGDILTVVKIGLGSQRWVEVTRGPPAGFHFDARFKSRSLSDGDSIFFDGYTRTEKTKSGISNLLAYHVEKDEWSAFPPPPLDPLDPSPWMRDSGYSPVFLYSFQPGLNPFVAV